jgi:hypothetical protein
LHFLAATVFVAAAAAAAAEWRMLSRAVACRDLKYADEAQEGKEEVDAKTNSTTAGPLPPASSMQVG